MGEVRLVIAARVLAAWIVGEQQTVAIKRQQSSGEKSF